MTHELFRSAEIKQKNVNYNGEGQVKMNVFSCPAPRNGDVLKIQFKSRGTGQDCRQLKGSNGKLQRYRPPVMMYKSDLTVNGTIWLQLISCVSSSNQTK
jgi:hypothetical protein